MGGGDDDSGTVAAAKSVVSNREGVEEAEVGSGEAVIEVGVGGTKDISRIEAIGKVPGIKSNNNDTKTPETIARSLEHQKEDCPNFQRKEKNQLGGNELKAEASEPTATQTDARGDGVRASRTMVGVTVPRACELRVASRRSSTLDSKLPACGPGSSKGNGLAKATGETKGAREVGSTGEEARNDLTPRTGAVEDKDHGVERLLENDPAYSVECLLYLRWWVIWWVGVSSVARDRRFH